MVGLGYEGTYAGEQEPYGMSGPGPYTLKLFLPPSFLISFISVPEPSRMPPIGTIKLGFGAAGAIFGKIGVSFVVVPRAFSVGRGVSACLGLCTLFTITGLRALVAFFFGTSVCRIVFFIGDSFTGSVGTLNGPL